MTMLDTVREAQTRSLEQMKSVQEEIVSYNERIADTMLGAMPDIDSPFAEYMPKPTEVVDAYYSFLGDVHAANMDFASRMASAWEKAADGPDAPATKGK